MDIRAALRSQYHASLAMVREAIDKCPEDLWLKPAEPQAFWQIAYHALFFAHFYSQQGEAGFKRWEKHHEDRSDPYTREEAQEYWSFCDARIDEDIDRLDLDTLDCGFPWYSMPKLDHQIMNIRHIQQHAGQLSELLFQRGIDTGWTGTSP